ncbi:MAG: SUMF1/EgtB/PvdO family nonheme iron enzyme [Planctomycetaceae bacterium]|nr:SUMF1/EgtB/PvdO family nonheme iron enzyme [Planctomycetaceae bacterium]
MTRIFLLLFLVLSTSASAAESTFEIDAWAFDRGNFAVYTDQYTGGGPPIIANGGGPPSVVEFDIPFPVAGTYRFSLLVAQIEIRPVEVLLDGKSLGKFCTEKQTPTWNSIDGVWETPLELPIPNAGLHTIQFRCEPHPPPHIAKLKFESDQSFPDGWVLERPKAKKLPKIEQQDQGEANFTAAEPNVDAIRRAILDLIETCGEKYPGGQEYLRQLDELAKLDSETAKQELEKLRFEAVYKNNPVIDFDRILLVRRHNKGPALGFVANWESNSSLPKSGYDDEIMLLDAKMPENELTPYYKPDRDTLVNHLCLDFDASRLMFSAVGDNDRWHLFEIKGKEITQLTHGDKDVDFYDSCYLPDGRVMLTCTAAMVGVPCVAGSSHVANLFLLDPQSGTVRQLAFDQEHNWNPTVKNDGRILYTRWEYIDIPHSNSRLLFHCNPDGTSQLEYYGSNSYWPNSIFYAKAIPNHPTKVIGVVTGHHDFGQMGELVIFDPAISRSEADGAVQRIPGYGKRVEAKVVDGLTRNAWPKFVHPAPLSEKYFLVSAKLTPQSNFGIYFVDVFDNMILLKELPDNALVEPTPLKVTKRPPIIPDRIDPDRDDANIFVSNIYEGPGLKNIPPGTVKELRVFTYHFAYHGAGGLYGSVGQDGPWDVRGVLGTVPVEEDGSVHFRAPANTPIGVLPLDKNGQALQLMRSWMTAMPGENLHCNGCHESQNSTPPSLTKLPLAMQKPVAEIQPYNPPNPDGNSLLQQLNVRGFSFQEQVQPILDKYCISCHNGEYENEVQTAMVQDRPVGTARDGKPFALDLRGDRQIVGWSSVIAGNCGSHWGGKWTPGYDNLQRFVRRPGIESDYGLLSPMEFAANTTELVQILKAGHYGVKLDVDSWNRLITWIDMNTPYHGNWSDINGGNQLDHIAKRRLDLAEMYGAIAVDYESRQTIESRQTADGRRQNADGRRQEEVFSMIPTPLPEIPAVSVPKTLSEPMVLELGDGHEIRLRKVGDFWIGEYEITNAQFRKFDSTHDSGIESRHNYQFGRRGYGVNDDELPVVRVNWNQANEFCRWLAKKSGKNVQLPTEQQWMQAAGAGAKTPFWFGDLDTDFSPFANMGDISLKEFAACTTYMNYTSVRIIDNPNPFDDRVPKDERFNDGNFLHVKPGQYLPNPFGLYDMHGNVAEWTRSELDTSSGDKEKIVKGGSWHDRPYRCTTDFRISYPPYQPVFDVGFRIVVE